MYGSCAAIVPIAVALFQKGIPLGTALAFMMAIAAMSLPEAIALRRSMKVRLIIAFFSITTAGIILTGYLFNLVQALLQRRPVIVPCNRASGVRPALDRCHRCL